MFTSTFGFARSFRMPLAVVISDQERAGVDILTHGDFRLDEDMAGRSWHHYPFAALGRVRVIWDMAEAMNKICYIALRDAGCRCVQVEGRFPRPLRLGP